MRENALERACRTRAARRGCLLWKLRPTTAGMPDRVLIAPNGKVVWVEFKTLRGRLRPAQRVMLGKLHALGHDAYVVRAVDEFDAILDFVASL